VAWVSGGQELPTLVHRAFLHTRKFMPRKEKNVHKKLRGRPRGSRYAGNIPCRLPPKTLAAVDELAARDNVTRSEAIRRLIESALKAKVK
jgi:Ribbon-helix-helix protein, copG family